MRLGLLFFLVGSVLGAWLLLVFFVLPLFLEPDPGKTLFTMVVAAALAFPAASLYLSVPRLLDRYDPEPWSALLGCLLWGALFATGVSVAVNSVVGGIASAVFGEEVGAFLTTVVSAPLVEEATKGLAVLGMFWFLRREFDGLIDGMLYATFTAIGFAAVENVVYYTRSALTNGAVGLTGVFVLRGILTPWAHPVYTTMTGLSIGWARETSSPVMRWVAPVLGYMVAVLLHALWNGLASLAPITPVPFLLAIPFWLLLLIGYLALLWSLSQRRARILREHLQDEVALGNLDPDEVALVTSVWGLRRARRMWGAEGEELLRTAARLGMHKWHLSRAMRAGHSTLSEQRVGELRRRLAELRVRVAARQQASVSRMY